MLRPRAIRALLLEQVVGLSRPDADGAEPAAERLRGLRRRALVLVVVEWLAILVLILVRDSDLPYLTLGRTEQTAFAIGVLVVAVHSGFKLGQWEKLRSVERAVAELDRPETSD